MIRLGEGSLPLKGGCVLTIGNFDGVHIAHRALIEKTACIAKKMGLPSVVWTFGVHPQRFFGADGLKYITGETEKTLLVDKAGADMYFSAEFERYKDMSAEQFVGEVLVKQFGVRHVICGYDFSFGKGGKGTPDVLRELLVERHGVPLTVMEPVCAYGEAVSSTALRAVIREGDMEKAQVLLGRRYGFCLPVIHGKRLGHTIGSPTINQAIPEDRVVPAYGVYAAFCEVDGKVYKAVANVGVKPTVNSEGQAPVCETFIFDFNGELYGKSVWVYLCRYIRGEKRFDSVGELALQIERDKQAARLITDAEDKEGEAYV